MKGNFQVADLLACTEKGDCSHYLMATPTTSIMATEKAMSWQIFRVVLLVIDILVDGLQSWGLFNRNGAIISTKCGRAMSWIRSTTKACFSLNLSKPVF